MPSYTARELERDTGFDRRTIAYYVQEGLLPKVGRRGPRTRYPKLVRDRLLFIRRVREAEEEGEVPAVTLSDMRKVFERVPPALIAGVADGRIAVSPELVAEPSTAFRAPGMRRRALEERWGGGEMERPIGRMRGPERRARGPRAPADMGDVEEPVADEVYRTAGLRELEADEEREFGAAPQREADVPQVFLQLPPGAAGEPGRRGWRGRVARKFPTGAGRAPGGGSRARRCLRSGIRSRRFPAAFARGCPTSQRRLASVQQHLDADRDLAGHRAVSARDHGGGRGGRGEGSAGDGKGGREVGGVATLGVSARHPRPQEPATPCSQAPLRASARYV